MARRIWDKNARRLAGGGGSAKGWEVERRGSSNETISSHVRHRGLRKSARMLTGTNLTEAGTYNTFLKIVQTVRKATR